MANPKITNTSVLENYSPKERSTNFNKNEIERLQSLIGKYKDILLCKKTDFSICKQKENAWNCIEREFNAVGEIPRTLKQLKYKFDNMKRLLKKKARGKNQHMIETRDGQCTHFPPPQMSQDSENTDWLRSIMSTSVEGNKPLCDDDNITKPSNIEQDDFRLIDDDGTEQKCPVDKIVVHIKPEPLDDIQYSPSISQQQEDSDTSSTHSSLKRPISCTRKCPEKKKKEDHSEFNVTGRLKRDNKLASLDELHKLELQKMSESIAQLRELHEQKIKHNEEKHKMEMHKLQLEIEILRCKKIKLV